MSPPKSPTLSLERASRRQDNPNVKACPFCGGRPEIHERASEHTNTKRFHYICCMCGGITANAWKGGETAEEVISLWNARKP